MTTVSVPLSAAYSFPDTAIEFLLFNFNCIYLFFLCECTVLKASKTAQVDDVAWSKLRYVKAYI